MTEERQGRVLSIVVCGAGPAGEVGRLVDLAYERGWDVQVIATPAALEFIDVAGLEARTERPVRSRYRSPGQPRSPRSDAVIVAPATFNTINKLAAGISDTYVLGVLAEAPGLGVPVVILPFVNSALAARGPFRRSVEELRADGYRVLFGPGGFEPHPPGTGGERVECFPWRSALLAAEEMPAGAVA